MTLSFLARRTYACSRARLFGLSLALSITIVLGLGLTSPGMTAGTGDISQLWGSLGTDGCVSEDGTLGACGVVPDLSNPEAIVTSPDGKHVYVVSSDGSGDVLIFERKKAGNSGLSKGALILKGSATVSGAGKGLVLSPDGKHLYVAAGNAVFFFSRNKTNGALTSLGCVSKSEGACTTPKVDALMTPEGLAISKDGKHVYVAARGLQGVVVFARDKTSGVLSPVSGTSCVSEEGATDGCALGVGLKGATDVVVSPDGKTVYVIADASNAVAIFKRDTKTGQLTQAVSPDGCWSQTGQDGGTGATTICNDGRGLNGANGVAVSLDGKFVYVTSPHSNAIAIFSRDVKTGALTQAPSSDGCVSQNGDDGNGAAGEGQCTPADVGGLTMVQKVVVSQGGANLYTSGKGSGANAGAVSAFTRDETTGALTQLSCIGPDPDCGDAGVALEQLHGIAITKDGNHLYVTSPGGHAVGAFAID